MKEIRDIIKAFKLAQKGGKKAALATVVHVEGSSYRRPGARMLITEDGQLTGAISGGCLEGDALRKALLAINQQENKLVTYDTTDEEDAKFGVQLGCNGIVHILFEPIQTEKKYDPIYLLQQVINGRQDAVLVALFSLNGALQPGTNLLYLNNSIQSALTDTLQVQIVADVKEVMQSRSSYMKQYEHEAQLLNAFIEFIAPPIAIVIIGAGNDASPLVDIASVLGWHITVIDGRPTHATAQRFTKADKVLIAKPDEVLSQVTMDAQTAFVLMTHNYNYDMALLTELVTQDCNYIGILGPKKKLDRMFDELQEAGIPLQEDQRAKIYGPVGLDIGAETAEEIAVSVIAEIKTVFSNRLGSFLKEKEQPIHSRMSALVNYE